MKHKRLGEGQGKHNSRSEDVARENPRHMVLRGGRLRKTGRGVVTYAPWIGMLCAVAMGMGLATGDDASAQAACTQMPADSGMWVCSGTATTTQALSAASGGMLVVTDEADFSLMVAAGPALTLTGPSDSTGMMATFTQDIAASGTGSDNGHGIRLDHQGSGMVSLTTAAVSSAGVHAIYFDTQSGSTGTTITANGTITATRSSRVGIAGNHRGTGLLSVTAGDVAGGGEGISVGTVGDTDAGISIETTGAVTGDQGISARKLGSGALTITTGNVTASQQAGILANNWNVQGHTTITAMGDVTGATWGIDVDAGGNEDPSMGALRDRNTVGAVVVNLHGAVSGGTRNDQGAIRMRGGATQRIVFHSGARVTGVVRASHSNATMEFTAADGESDGNSFALTDLANFGAGGQQRFSDFDKTGAGTWELTGIQPTDKAFGSVDVMAGTLRLSGATVRIMGAEGARRMTVAPGATLVIDGISQLDNELDDDPDGANLRVEGSLALGSFGERGDTDDQFRIWGDYTIGGTVTLDVDFIGGMADLVRIQGEALPNLETRRATTVNLRSVGRITSTDGLRLPADPLIEIHGTRSTNNSFVPGKLFDGTTMFDFTLRHDGQHWRIGSVTANPDAPRLCPRQAMFGTYLCSGESGGSERLLGDTLVVEAASDFHLHSIHALTLVGGPHRSRRFILNPGATIEGAVTAESAGGVLELAAGRNQTGSMNLAARPDFINLNDVVKTGEGTWELVGAEPPNRRLDRSFHSVEVMEGTLRLRDAIIRIFNFASRDLTIAPGATLEIDGTNFLDNELNERGTTFGANLINNGTLALGSIFHSGDTGDRLTIWENYTGGGTMTLDVNFANNTADSLYIQRAARANAAGTPTMVNLRAAAPIFDTGSVTLTPVLIEIFGNSPADLFTAGKIYDGTMRHDFTLVQEGRNWKFGAIIAGSETPTACTEESTMGTYVCRAQVGDTQVLLASSGEALVVTNTEDFEAHVVSGNAIELRGVAGSMDMTATFTKGITATAGNAIHVDADGTGEIFITTDAVVSTGGNGIYFNADENVTGAAILANGMIRATGRGIVGDHYGTGVLSISAGDIEGGSAGIEVGTMGSTDAGISIETTGSVAGGRGIGAWKRGSGALTIATAAVAGTFSEGILANNWNAGGDTTITTSGSVSGGPAGIRVDADGQNDDIVNTGAVVINLGGPVIGTDGIAVEIDGGASQRLVLNPGAGSFTGTVSASRTDAILELAGNSGSREDTSFDLSQMSDFTGFVDFDKTGRGEWTLSGAQPMDRAFTSADFMAGTLRLSTAQFRPGATAFSVPADATLEIDGTSTIHGSLENEGHLSFFGFGDEATGDRLTIMDYTTGGSVTFNVNLADGMADQLTILGSIAAGSSATTVNLRATGDLDSNPMYPETLINVDSMSIGSGNDFEAGTLTLDFTDYDFTLTRNPQTGDWTVTAVDIETGAPTGMSGCSVQSTPGTWICSGFATMTHTLSAASGQALVVTDLPDFAPSVARGNAIVLRGAEGSTGVTATFTKDIAANGTGPEAGHGIRLHHQGSGAVSLTTAAIFSEGDNGIDFDTGSDSTGTSITANGRITATTAGKVGITGDHEGTGLLSVAAGAVDGGAAGITVGTGGDTDAGISIETTGTVTGDLGIGAWKRGTGALTITTADVTADVGAGILANNWNVRGDTTITANGDVTGATWGIQVDARGNDDSSMGPVRDRNEQGAVVVNIHGAVTGGSGNDQGAILMEGGATQKLVLHPGARITGAVGASHSNATLEFSARGGETGGNSFALTDLANFSAGGHRRFGDFDKTGAGVWELTGIQPGDKAFISADVMAGTLRLMGTSSSHAVVRLTGDSRNMTIASDATLEINGIGQLDNEADDDGFGGNLINNGNIELGFIGRNGETGDELRIWGNYTGGGTLTLDVDFANDTADYVRIQGDVLANAAGTPTTVNLRASAAIEGVPMLTPVLIEVFGESRNDRFVAGKIYDGTVRYDFTLMQEGKNWKFDEVEAGSAELATCLERSTGGSFICTGATSETQVFTAMSGEYLRVEDNEEFEADVDSGNAFTLTGASGSLGMNAYIRGGITADGGTGVHASHMGTGNVTITVSGEVSGMTGIHIGAMDAGSGIVMRVSGSVSGTASASPVAINMDGGASQTLVLAPGASITGAVIASRDDATLQLVGESSQTTGNSFALPDLGGFTNFVNLRKAGTGSWTLTGDQPGNREFSSAQVLRGTLRLQGADLRLASGGELTVAPNTELELVDTNTIHGDLTNFGVTEVEGTGTIQGDLVNLGNLALGSTTTNGEADDVLTVMGDYTAGGSVTLNVDFSSDSADRLAILGRVTRGGLNGDMATTVNLRAGTEITDTGSLTLPTAVLIDLAGTNNAMALANSADGDFVAGGLFDGAMRYPFTLERNRTTGDWHMTAVGAGSAAGCIRAQTGAVYVCDLPVSATQTLSAASGEYLRVTDRADFAAVVASGNAIELRGNSGSTGMYAYLTQAITANAGRGIDADHDGTGEVYIAAGAVAAGMDGIRLDSAATSGAVTLYGNGPISSSTGLGIWARKEGGDGDFLISATGAITTGMGSPTGSHGIFASNSGTGATTIETFDNITVHDAFRGISVMAGETAGATDIIARGVIDTGGVGIVADHNGTGDLTIISGGTIITGDEDPTETTTGIFADNDGAGATTIRANHIETKNTGGAGHPNDTGHGIHADNAAGAGAMSIFVAGVIDAAAKGILANHNGTGSLTINVSPSGYIYARGVPLRNSKRGRGIEASTGATAEDLIIEAGGGIMATDIGIRANHAGTGELRITTRGVTSDLCSGIDFDSGPDSTGATVIANGRVAGSMDGGANICPGTGTGANHGIQGEHLGSGMLTVTAGDVVGGAGGITVNNKAPGQGPGDGISVEARGFVEGDSGISVWKRGPGALTITTGHVDGRLGVGILANNWDARGNTTVTTMGTVYGKTWGIQIAADGGPNPGEDRNTQGAVVVNLHGPVTGNDEGAIDMRGGATQRIVFHSGSSVSGEVRASHSNATLEFSAARGETSGNTFALTGLSGFRAGGGNRFGDFDKTGEGTWELTGNQPGDKAFSTVDVMGGTLRLRDATVRIFNLASRDVTVASGATLEIDGRNFLDNEANEASGPGVGANLINNGTLALGSLMAPGDTGDRLTIWESYAGGGSVVLDVDLRGGTADSVYIQGDARPGAATTVNLRAGGRITNTDSVTLPPDALIEIIGASANDRFTAGKLFDGTTEYDFTLAHDGQNWRITGLTANPEAPRLCDQSTSGTYLCSGVSGGSERLLGDPLVVEAASDLHLHSSDTLTLVGGTQRNRRFILNPGAIIDGRVEAETTGGVLELAAGRRQTGSMNLAARPDFTNLNDMVKTGEGIWELTGTETPGKDLDKSFHSVNVMEGTLRLRDATVRIFNFTSRDLTIAPGATLEIDGMMNFLDNEVDEGVGANLINSGTLALGSISHTGDTGDRLTIWENYTGGGTITLDVNFADNTADSLYIHLDARANPAGTVTTVNLRTAAPITDTGSVTLMPALIQINGNSPDGLFMGGNIYDGTMRHDFTLVKDGKNWRFGAITANTGTPTSCVEDQSTGGTYVCMGPVNETQELAAGAGETLVVTNDEDFIAIVARGDAFILTSAPDSKGMSLTLTREVTAPGIGVLARHSGSGPTSIVVADVASTGDQSGIYVRDASGSGAMTVVANGDISGGRNAIDVAHGGSGMLSITALGTLDSGRRGGIYFNTHNVAGTGVDITATGGITATGSGADRHGIGGTHRGSGPISVTAGTIDATRSGIAVGNMADRGATSLTINATGAITSTLQRGIAAWHHGTGDLAIAAAAITASGTGDMGHGILANNLAEDMAGDTLVTTGGDVSGTIGIEVNHTAATGDVVVTLGGSATGTGGVAIDLEGGANQKLVLNPGSGINGAIMASRDDAILELSSIVGATEGTSLDLSSLGSGSNFVNLDKTGSGTWELTGEQGPMTNEFVSADVMEGTLRLNEAVFLSIRGDMTIASRATLEIEGESVLRGNLISSGGTLSLGSVFGNGDTGDRLTIMRNYTTGGSVTLDVDLENGMADQLVISGSVTRGSEATTVNLRSGVQILDPSDGMGLIPTLPTEALIHLGGSSPLDDSEDGDFVAGKVFDGTLQYDFTLVRANTDGGWRITAIDVDSGTAVGCTEDSPMGTYVCRGPVSETQEFVARSEEMLVVTNTPDFMANVASGNAFTLTSASDSTGMSLTLTREVTAAARGVHASHSGSGPTSVVVADVASTGDHYGVYVRDAEGSADMTIVANGDISGGRNAIDVRHRGSGMLSITASGTLDSGRQGGIYFHTDNPANTGLSITATGRITATGSGSDRHGIGGTHRGAGAISVSAGAIDATQSGIAVGTMADRGATSFTINVTGAITSTHQHGVAAWHDGTEDLTINTAAITAGMDASRTGAEGLEGIGIQANNRSGMGDTLVTTRGDVSGTKGIDVNHTGTTGDVIVALGGSVSSRLANGVAVELSGGASQKLVLNPGAGRFSGTVDASDTSATLEFAGMSGATGSTSFGLFQLSGFSNFTAFNKIETGTWTLTGAQSEDKAFGSADIVGGTIRLADAMFRASTTTIRSGGTLEIDGANTIHGALNNSSNGTVAFHRANDEATGDRLAVTDYTTGGLVTFNVNLADGTADQLIVSGAVSGSSASMVNIRAVGNVGGATLPTAALIDVADSSVGATTNFEAGTLSTGSTNYDFTLTRDPSTGDWRITAIDAGTTPPEPVAGCAEQLTGGTYICSGTATETQNLAASSGETLMVTDEPGFSINVASGNAFRLSSDNASRGMNVTLDSNVTATDGTALYAEHSGTGAVSITTAGVSGGGSAGHGIYVLARNTDSTTMTIEATGAITAATGNGVRAVHPGTGAFSVTTADVTSSGEYTGISAFLDNATSVSSTTITTRGDVSGSKGISVSVADNLQGTLADLSDDTDGLSPIVVTLGGSVTGTDTRDPIAVEMAGGASHSLVLNPGAGTFTGAVTSDKTGGVILELSGISGASGSTSFDLGQLEHFENFHDFDKTGTGTWTLTGVQEAGENEFASADVMRGILRLNAATFRIASGGGMTIASGATLEIDGTSVLHGDLVNGGSVALGSTASNGDTDDKITVMGGYTTGGTLTLNVDFTNGDADQLEITGMVTRGSAATTVNLRAGAAITDRNSATLPTEALIDLAGTGSSADGDFVAGMILDGTMQYAYTLVRDGTSGDWNVTAVGAGTPIPMAACEEQSTGGTFICSGTSNTTETLEAASGERLVVTDAADFSIRTTSGNAFALAGASGSTGMSVTLDSNITAVAGTGISATHRGSGPVSITARGNVSGLTGIEVSTANTGSAVVVTIGGSVRGTAPSNPVAINLDGGASQRLVLNPGAGITGAVNAGRSDAVLELNATPSQTSGNSFALGGLSEYTNFLNLDKTGTGTWTLTGTQPTNKAFTSADVMAGILRLDAATLRLSAGRDMTIEEGATLEVDGESTIDGDLANSGNLSLFTSSDDATGDRLTVTGGYVKGGTLTLNANLANGMADQLVIEGDVSGSATTRVNVRATGNVNDPTLPTAALIDVTGASADGDFAAGQVHVGSMQYDFTLAHTSGDWTITAIDTEPVTPRPPGTLIPSVPTIESYAATISQLSRLPSLQDRIGDRQWSGEAGVGVWALSDLYRAEYEPGNTMGMSSFEISNYQLRFGVEVPIAYGFSLGGNAAFLQANSEVSSSAGNGEIDTESGFALGATATWESEAGLYVDGQWQYAGFTSDLISEDGATRTIQTSENDATAWSASGEVGYRIALGDMKIVPQGQLIWSDAEFDDFTDRTMARITLEDGDTLTGRLGVSASGEWRGDGMQGGFYGNADLYVAFDGETAANMDGDTLVSEMEEVSIGLGAGATLEFDEHRSLFGEVSTVYGDEVAEYRASIGFRFGF